MESKKTKKSVKEYEKFLSEEIEAKSRVEMKPVKRDCPHCGRCPVCGRGGVEVTPWYPYREYPYWDTGSTNADGVTITFKDDCVYCK